MIAPDLVEFALELARAARAETLPLWKGGCAVEDKGSEAFDPVTQADRRAEQGMRDLIHERFPDHGVSGEEFGDEPSSGPFTWSLDPVDGTRSFMCGLPSWTTLVALLENGAPVLGLIDAPALDETYVGTGAAARMICTGEPRPLCTSGCTRLAEARFSTTDPFLLGDGTGFERIRDAVRVTRYGHDGYAYARLAAGSLDLVVEGGLRPHDYNAVIPVIRGAGGYIGDWRGGCDFNGGQVVAAASRKLYDEAVALLA